MNLCITFIYNASYVFPLDSVNCSVVSTAFGPLIIRAWPFRRMVVMNGFTQAGWHSVTEERHHFSSWEPDFVFKLSHPPSTLLQVTIVGLFKTYFKTQMFKLNWHESPSTWAALQYFLFPTSFEAVNHGAQERRWAVRWLQHGGGLTLYRGMSSADTIKLGQLKSTSAQPSLTLLIMIHNNWFYSFLIPKNILYINSCSTIMVHIWNFSSTLILWSVFSGIVS